ncbi:YtxH domain-containing protein [Candidatus Dojkabacteria bacterium]|nr:YtxH domain-containing protein [Candidatus Dojkabacteria bacterium]
MNDNRASNIFSFLGGAMIGGVIGAGVALLFAPQSGKETRELLKKKVEDVGEDIKKFQKKMEPKLKQVKQNLAKTLHVGAR